MNVDGSSDKGCVCVPPSKFSLVLYTSIVKFFLNKFIPKYFVSLVSCFGDNCSFIFQLVHRNTIDYSIIKSYLNLQGHTHTHNHVIGIPAFQCE